MFHFAEFLVVYGRYREGSHITSVPVHFMYAWKHRLKSLDPPHSIFVEIHSGINCRGHSTQVGLWQFKVYL